uniref:Tower domain-containing protein n=1 Tax=Stegastes partitus TaxID=144197 RepID=A0A3B5AWI9_9TELE
PFSTFLHQYWFKNTKSKSKHIFVIHYELCANQEGNFKTPLRKPEVDSQLFSTPKVFRHRPSLSPETEDEQSFTTEQGNVFFLCLCSKIHIHVSPVYFFYLFFLLIQASYAKHISESLGAQINPDISWTSSFNTPPAVPSTLILCKQMTHIFVRKLFPSLSNVSTVGVASSHDSPQTSLNQSESVWRQKLPDAIEDGEIRTTVASVLDGAENVLSIFFTNSSSALRKVKPNKTKRKQIIPAIEHGCSSTDVSTTNNAESSQGETADHPLSPPVKSGDAGITQWSPLSLSEISSSAVDNNILTEQPKSGSDSGQPFRAPINITDSGFIKKNRKFVYTVGTVKTQSQGKDAEPQKMGQEVSVKQLEKGPGGTDCCTIGQKQGNLAGENLPPSVQANVQDLDMSQLYRDFAQDFSQMPDSGILSKATEDTRNHFSPSACLSAMKQAKQKAKQADFPRNCDGVRSRRPVSATNQNCSVNEGTASDSGFQSSVADVTHMTASSLVLPFSENTGQSQQWSGFKTDIQRTMDIHKTTPFPSRDKANGKVRSGVEAETELSNAQRSHLKERQILDPGIESGLHIASNATQPPSSAKGAVNSINCIPLNGQIHGSLPEETAVSLPSVSTSGFKTASNRSIRISLANLEKAKHLFEESQNERTFSGQLNKSDLATKHKISTSNGPVRSATSNSNQQLSLSETSVDVSCQLTASQKADVTELCTLLEEADSQFEFTPVKIPEVQQHCQDDAKDKELDPDFLTGIDFDDSFSSDAEKHLATVKPDKMTSVSDDKTNSRTSNNTSKSPGASLSSVTRQKSSTGDVSFISEHISEGSSCVMATKPKSLQRAEHTETSRLENKNPLMLGAAFKTAGGNVLSVSKTCLSKARALFADLQENLTDEKSLDKQNSETDDKTKQQCSGDSNTGKESLKFTLKDNCHVGERIQGCFSSMESDVCADKQITSATSKDAARSFKNSKLDSTMCQSGFHMASGKGISISAKYMQQADAFFKDCDAMDPNDGMSGKHKKSQKPVSERVDKKKNHSKYTMSFRGNPFSTSNCDGFCTASGKKVSVSADALQRAKSLFSDTPDVSHKKSSDKKQDNGENTKKIHCGFTTAGGKKVHVSQKNLLKAQHLLSESDSVSTKAMQEADGSLKDCQMDCNNATPVKCGSIAPLSRSDNQKKTLSKLKPDQRLEVNVSEQPEDGCTEHTNKQGKKREDAVPPQNGGFRTASGKGVVISSEALKKAKSLLSECEKMEDKISVTPPRSKIPVPAPSFSNSGFLAASGKPVACPNGKSLAL